MYDSIGCFVVASHFQIYSGVGIETNKSLGTEAVVVQLAAVHASAVHTRSQVIWVISHGFEPYVHQCASREASVQKSGDRFVSVEPMPIYAEACDTTLVRIKDTFCIYVTSTSA